MIREMLEVRPPLWAMMLTGALPGPAVTSPVESTVAQLEYEDDQVTFASGTTRPAAEYTVALRRTVSPGARRAFSGLRVIQPPSRGTCAAT